MPTDSGAAPEPPAAAPASPPASDPPTDPPKPAVDPPPQTGAPSLSVPSVRSPETLPDLGAPELEPGLLARVRRFLLGRPRDLTDRRLYHRLALVPFLAWVGLGADGLSSSAYGPEEAFRTLGEHGYLALGLAALMAITVLLISSAYSLIIEEFPHGGGGYVVATKLLGERAGLVSGCALVVDYILTITVSIAAAGEALFSLLPAGYQDWKLAFEIFLIVELTLLNLRGVRESILTLTPVFIGFLLTHILLIGGGLVMHLPDLPRTLSLAGSDFRTGLGMLGAGGMLALFVHSYSLGGGTYTGIEAVSNSLTMMREPVVRTARRTMAYMATSLAITAAGLLVCYLLYQVAHEPGKTMNTVLAERVFGEMHFGRAFVILTMLCEAALLVVAGQAGFLDGPRVLVNMAVDSWVPHSFAGLSNRLTIQNGILLMSGASIGALLYTHGNVSALVVMYSINVFLTFSLSLFGMSLVTWRSRRGREHWRRRTTLFTSSFALCATILAVTTWEKFEEGGWITLVVTGTFVLVCMLIRMHYRTVQAKMDQLGAELGVLPDTPAPLLPPPDPAQPTAGVLVNAWGGLGVHTVLNIYRAFPGHFKGVVFVSIGVVDSGGFKGEGAVEALAASTQATLDRYVELARRLGVPADARMAIGTDVVEEGEKLCLAVARDYPRVTFFAGKIIFQRERWWQRLLHNETAIAIQRRLQWAGRTMVIMPARVR